MLNAGTHSPRLPLQAQPGGQATPSPRKRDLRLTKGRSELEVTLLKERDLR